MGANFKLKRNWIILFFVWMISLPSFAQNYTDEEIGFDVEMNKNDLRSRGITTNEDLDREIQAMRQSFISSFTIQKKIEEEILQKINLEQNSKRRLLKATADIPTSEKEALLAFYNSTNGAGWLNKKGWDFDTPVTSGNGNTGWYGVKVENGHVVSLILTYNNLTGYLPKEIGELKYLTQLNLQSNILGGIIPLEISKLGNLLHIDLSNNLLNGNIPNEIGQLKKLRILYLAGNRLTGTIPKEICDLIDLEILFLAGSRIDGNNLTGGIPEEIGNLTKLWLLNLSNNSSLIGFLPVGICNLKSLKQLTLVNTGISGSIPESIGQLKELQSLSLQDNGIEGEIPESIGSLSNLSHLDLCMNKLRGAIPAEIGSLTKLAELHLQYNQLSGNIPKEIGSSPVIDLYLHYNQLTGTIPIEIGKLGNSLRTFCVIGNKLTGTIPREIGQLSELKFFSISFNLITGSIPSEIINLKNLSALELDNNQLEGVIPDISNLPANTRMYIYGNKFRFADMVPQFIGTTKKIIYSTQKNIDTPKTITSIIGESVKLVMYEDNRYLPEETFQWFKDDDILISGATSREYTISNVTAEDIGIYTCVARHSQVSSINGLVLRREPITLNVLNCGTLNGSIRVQQSYQKMYINTESYIVVDNINAALPNIVNYSWEIKDPKDVISKYDINNNLFLYKFTQGGKYDIKVTVTDLNGCTNTFAANANIEPESCTVTNPNSPIIKNLLLALATKLHSLPAGTVKNGYKCLELDALKPYLLDQNPAIYSFEYSDIYHYIGFSFTNKKEHDVVIGAYSDKVVDFDLSKFQRPDELTDIDNMIHINTWVSRIDFCPKELSCVSHVALVVDESGSIDKIQAAKIKKQLKAFILQQANTNDALGANIYVSLTGMSDSDENVRTDFISPVKVSNNPSTLNQFNAWIDSYGQRTAAKGISASSDYWRSGLEGALSYTMKPNVVLMITDGCQTANVDRLKETMKKFNNAPGSDSKLPHLYIVGIENGFYVDENFYVNKAPETDPNYNPTLLVNTVTPHLTKSLKYLLDLPDTEFPKSDINQFNTATYYGHQDFSFFNSDEHYLSDKLINSEFVCGTASTKDFCDDCFSFKPEPDKEYILSAWVKEEVPFQVKTFDNPSIKIIFYNNKEALDIRAHIIDSLNVKPNGAIIEGWQRIFKKFKVPANTITLGIELENNSKSVAVYFDDIRIHPLQGSVKSFVYDPLTFKLMAELDENNYGTFYEYDNEGGLVRVKKETEKGVKTIQETRSGNVISSSP